MFDLLTLLLLLSDVVLATTVFILVAKPDLGVAFVLRRNGGVRDDWFQEHISPEELVRLRNSARLLGYLGLCLVFAWSFLVGVVMTVGRLLS